MSRVLKVAGTKCREFFLATFATLSTVFCSFRFFRNIKYPRLLKVRFLATFNTLLATFSFLIEKIFATFYFSPPVFNTFFSLFSSFSFSVKGNYSGQNPLFFPLPSTEISLFLPCFLVKKKSNVKVC